jgi:uncharacterized membrane protein YkvA (DUF1232 family)
MLKTLAIWWKALLSPRTPPSAKVLVALGLIYGVSPLDLIPDLIPLLGQTDDIGVLIIVLLFFLRATRSVRADLHKRDAIETTARRAS